MAMKAAKMVAQGIAEYVDAERLMRDLGLLRDTDDDKKAE